MRLSDELGADPSPDLLRLHTQVLRRDPALDVRPPGAARVAPSTGIPTAVPMPRPAQLPAPVGHFTGRVQQLAALDDLLPESGGETPIAVVSGAAGAGKTALAVQWAHRVAERFPDGQLFVDLRGHEPDGALTSSDALAHILRSLGVPADHTPTPVAEQAALYRSLLHGKRILLVLDNAASVDVVLPLVPASATNMLLLTSRRTMAALATHHAVRAIGVDEFSADEARALLVVLLGADRAGIDGEAADDLARLCGRLPLALRIAAAKLAGQPGRPIRDFVAELAGVHRLDALALEGGSRSVRAVFASA
ncbi:MAG TPA: ATP-binding protein, partial [Pilimelia sp.]|nr:ATP-binding protein [Pilimelia sp.]